MKNFFFALVFVTFGLSFSMGTTSAAVVNFEDTGGSSLAYRGLSFTDQGLTFTIAADPFNFQYTVDGRQTPSPAEGVNNGTNFYTAFPETNITSNDGSTFSLNQLDLGLSLFALPTENAVLTGFALNGGSFTTNVSLNNTSFQTFALSGFNDLSRLNISLVTGYFAIDNIHFNETNVGIPEPTTVALLGIGLLGFAASRRKGAKRKKV